MVLGVAHFLYGMLNGLALKLASKWPHRFKFGMNRVRECVMRTVYDAQFSSLLAFNRGKMGETLHYSQVFACL